MHTYGEKLKTYTYFKNLYLYRWCLPLIKLGNERDLQVKDLYRVTPKDESEKLRNILQT